jgi:hypothetical protein
VSALAALDEELNRTNQERYVTPQVQPRLIIDLLHNGRHLRGLVDTGSEINLISEAAVTLMGLTPQESTRHTQVSLALKEQPTAPIVLRHHILATLSDPNSEWSFKDVHLKIGPICGDYDLILGTPFLSNFCLSVSLVSRSLRCDRTGQAIIDYRQSEMNPIHDNIAVLSTLEGQSVYPCELSEQKVLAEFKDLFPVDIPAISEEAEASGQFTDGSFPTQMQKESSTVRHKIVLTDVNAVFNEKQYAYPGKHLVPWRKLLDQHVEAGRIRRSTSQYASPSLIIPKKDPTALPRWVCDYRKLNSLTVKDRSPLPNVDELIRLVGSGKVFSILGQTNAFFQTRMREADIPLTAVKTPWGLYKWRVMPMGLTNAPATHQAQLEEALGELLNDFCVVYLDDIVIYSDSFA